MRLPVFLAAVAIAGLLSVSLVAAHPTTTAVIVVGKPKPASHVRVVDGARYGVLDLNVKPRSTRVWIDGTLRGTCKAFDGSPSKLALAPGFHTIRFVTPEGFEAARDLRVRAGVEVNIGLDLR